MTAKPISIFRLIVPTIVGAGMVGIIVSLDSLDARREADACRTLARRVEGGELSLDRYMSTRCKAKYLPTELIVGAKN